LDLILQDIFNLLPNMNVEALSTSLAVKGNDMMAVIYLASLIRSVLALHRLIDNKEQRMWSVSHPDMDASFACSRRVGGSASLNALTCQADEYDR
jgi:26S proteasome regulatory subunit N8